MEFYCSAPVPAQVRELYEKLKRCWCAQTCAPRLRAQWSERNPTCGQCSVTAFLAQDVLGGKVYGIPLEDGSFHCYNEALGVTFDLTCAQFPGESLNYANNPEQHRETHFAKEEKRQRYELLKELYREATGSGAGIRGGL